MEFAQFCATSRVVIVAGKGGVGKTVVTAALADAAARTGCRVLAVELEGKSGLGEFLGSPPLGHHATEIRPGLRGRALRADQALQEWLTERGLQAVSDRLVRTGTLDVIATAVPGMRDLLLLAKIKQLESAGIADLILVDAPAAGHAVSFLRSPRGLLDAFRAGPVRAQADAVIAMLTDPARCRVLLVTRPEETPVNEVVDTAYALEDRVGIQLGPVVVNALTPAPDPLGPAGRGLLGPAELGALDHLDDFLRLRHTAETAQCERLARMLPLPQLRLPFVTESLDPVAVARLGDALAVEVGRLVAERP
jgi:anion-transporting  ArsA/GET3 family ATPase